MNNKKWYLCKVQNINEEMKKVKEQYLVFAEEVTDAEGKLSYLKKRTTDFIVASVQELPLYAVWPNSKAGKYWWKTKISFITLDEKGKEVKRSSQAMVEADTIEEAIAHVHKKMKGGLYDYEISAMTETPILEVINIEEL